MFILGHDDPNHPAMQVWNFLSLFKLRRTYEHEQGTTWIELFILFQLMGGDTSCAVFGRQNNRGIRKESTKCALAVFKKIVRHVVSVCFVHAEQEFFKPSKLPVHRLLPMGFSNFASCISACIVLDPLHEIPMLCALLSMRMGMTIAKRAAWHEGTLEVKPTKLLYRGAPPWRKHKLISNKFEKVAKDNLAKAWPNGLGMDFVCRNFLLYCPGCNADMQAANKRLYHDGKWTSLKCTQCEASRTARRWNCACDIPWPGCEHHGPFGFACKSQAKVKRASEGTSLQPSSRACLPSPSSTTAFLYSSRAAMRQGLTVTVEKRQHHLLDGALATCRIGSKQRRTSVGTVAQRKRSLPAQADGQRRGTNPAALNVAAIAAITRARSSRDQPLQSFHAPG